MRNIKCFECAGGAAGATAVSFDTFFSSFHFEKNTQDDSGGSASGLSAVVGLRSGFRLGSNPFSRCGHGRAFTYNYVKTHPEHPAPHDLSASQSEAARSECVVPEAAPALGSSSFITDATGYATQHLQPACRSFGAGRYLPFGEPMRLPALSSRTPLKIISESEQTFVDQQNGYDARYTFSAKEKDDETQYSYFGARYYDSDLSVWLSVDPMSDKYPSMSPYMYCGGNPVMIVDPDGRDWFENEETGDVYYNPNMKKGDEGTGDMKGSGWVHMGKNNMFGKNDQVLVQNYSKSAEIGSVQAPLYEQGTDRKIGNEPLRTAMFKGENAKSFMEDQGYDYNPVQQTIYKYFPSVQIQQTPRQPSIELQITEKSRYMTSDYYATGKGAISDVLMNYSPLGIETVGRYEINYSNGFGAKYLKVFDFFYPSSPAVLNSWSEYRNNTDLINTFRKQYGTK